MLNITASNRCIAVQNTLGWSAIVSCTCELIIFYFFSVWLELYVILTLGLLSTELTVNGALRAVIVALIQTCVRDRMCTFSPHG